MANKERGKMKKEYQKPEVEIIEIEAVDIITDSDESEEIRP